MNLNEAKKKLTELKIEVEERIKRTHAHTYNRKEPVSANFSEQIKQTESDGLVRILEIESTHELQQIDIALERIEAGNYLHCVSCGEDIGEARLSSMLFTDKCITCASDDE